MCVKVRILIFVGHLDQIIYRDAVPQVQLIVIIQEVVALALLLELDVDVKMCFRIVIVINNVHFLRDVAVRVQNLVIVILL